MNTIIETIIDTASGESITLDVKENCAHHLYIYADAHLNIRLHKNSDCTIFVFLISGESADVKINISHVGEKSKLAIRGVLLGMTSEKISLSVVVHHTASFGTTEESIYGIFQNSSVGDFKGKIVVDKDTKQNKAFQNNKNILLSTQAKVYTEPVLEIYSDDVVCTHGAVSGSVETELVEYFRARGIDEITTKKLIAKGYAEEVVTMVSNQNIRDTLSDKLTHIISL